MMQESIIKLNLSSFNDKIGKRKGFGKIYYDVEDGFGSVRDLYEKARKVDVGITLDMVSAWMRAQPQQANKKLQELQFSHCSVSQV